MSEKNQTYEITKMIDREVTLPEKITYWIYVVTYMTL